MTLDVHHPSAADVDPFGEGLSARRCRQRASERDKSQQFHDDVFHGYSLPSIHLSSPENPQITLAMIGPWVNRAVERESSFF